jgi:hypothetical protein
MRYGVRRKMVNERILITGVPKSGKTTICEKYDGKILHTDDLIGQMEWSEISLEVSNWFNNDYDVIEGVTVPRALRKWLANGGVGKPCDKIIVLTKPKINVTPQQIGMGKGVLSVLDEVKGELMTRGVIFEVK